VLLSDSALLVLKLIPAFVKLLLGHFDALAEHRDQQHCKQIVQSDPKIIGRR
jgi:hypothetical protein